MWKFKGESSGVAFENEMCENFCIHSAMLYANNFYPSFHIPDFRFQVLSFYVSQRWGDLPA